MQPPPNRTVVALFVRAPVPGQVKTRLAADLGREGACRLYQAMVVDILANIRACPFPVYLFYEGAGPGGLPEAWLGASARAIAQHGEGIGERMAAAFERCFAENIQQVVLVGSDIPGLDADRIVGASAALASHDVVITPVVDGGYCLIALKQESYRRALFEGVPWSTELVLRVTLHKIEQNKMSVSLQSNLQDIDTIDDVERYCRKPCATAHATNALLKALGQARFKG